MRIIAAMLVLLALTTPCFADPSHRVRGTSPRETRLINELLARSETARALVAEIESTDLIVYVQLTGDQSAGRAATRLAANAGNNRYLRIVIGLMTQPADRLALLAHELQHAVEIGRVREVRDDASLRRLYARIGEDSRAHSAFETTAAREVGTRVLRELLMAPGSSRQGDRD